VTQSDTKSDSDFLAHKIANLRIFEDDIGKFNLSALEVRGEILVVSQFTLYADVKKGRRPDFGAAARPEQAEPLIASLADTLSAMGLHVERGKFQAHMLVEIWNDGPVTIVLDSQP
jgi:D-tyrosyl-tRNA(Tyr) deacylase